MDTIQIDSPVPGKGLPLWAWWVIGIGIIIAVTAGDRQLENKKKQAEEVGAKLVEVITNLKKFSTRNIAKVFNL